MTFPQWRWPGQSSMSPPLLTVCLLNGSSCHLFQSRCITVKSTTARYVNVFVYLSCLFSRWSNNIDCKKGSVDRKCLQTVVAFSCWLNTSLIVIALQLKCASEILEHVFVSFQAVHLGSLQVRTHYFTHVYTISNLTKKKKIMCLSKPKYHQWVINITNRDRGVKSIEKVDSCRNYTLAVRCALPEAPWSSWSHETTVLTRLKGKNAKRPFKKMQT